ncbi:hypothetical protein Lepto7376_2279 [[Leptolyngbya] sp. PCC 7376]|uniref:hypothetical protein n=1 Tax=[Leptolyngbya] sp. PCC 7376 TaxID=111781 RepID=UPI00029F22BC|nr:hypothetical protein [[Leptolyngbya] sp. PCC 7376]AFY38569.1 hypothetical protein Lepto7376_2279 [[Leptolyngbya] sp. PCC 7376]
MKRTNKKQKSSNYFWSQIKKQSHVKECFCKDKTCNSQIISAHSIQNNRILNKISHHGEVMCVKLGDGKAFMQKVGRKKATTFTGFCHKHDGEIFKPIESQYYLANNKEQNFLFAYRALAKEWHAKKFSVNAYQNGIKELKRIHGEKPEHLQVMLYGARCAVNQMESDRKIFNHALKTKNYDLIYSRLYTFHEEYHIAVSSTFNLIEILCKEEPSLGDKKYIYFTIFPQNGKTYILFSCLKKYRKHFSKLMNEPKNLSIEQRKIFLSNIIAIHIENFVISPLSYARLTEDEKQSFKELYMYTLYQSSLPSKKLQKINLFK